MLGCKSLFSSLFVLTFFPFFLFSFHPLSFHSVLCANNSIWCDCQHSHFNPMMCFLISSAISKTFFSHFFSGTTMFKFKACLEKMTTQSRCLIGENGNCFDVSCDKIALRCHLNMVVQKSFISQTPNKFEARNLTLFSLL